MNIRNPFFPVPVLPVFGAAASLVVASATAAPMGFLSSIAPYAMRVGPDYSIVPILSVGDRVPRTSNPLQQYQMVGIPDGLGAHRNGDGTITVFMNHELRNTVQSEPIAGAPLNRGAIISRLILAPDGSVLSGDRAYDVVYFENTLVGPAAEVGNSTPGFMRFCSGSLAAEAAGFDVRSILQAKKAAARPRLMGAADS